MVSIKSKINNLTEKYKGMVDTPSVRMQMEVEANAVVAEAVDQGVLKDVVGKSVESETFAAKTKLEELDVVIADVKEPAPEPEPEPKEETEEEFLKRLTPLFGERKLKI